MWCDWRFNTDVKIGCWNFREHGYPKNSQGIIEAFVSYESKTIFVGNPYLNVLCSDKVTIGEKIYEDIEALIDTLTHETVHLILARKIDYFESWSDPEADDQYFATHGWDRISGELKN